MTGPTSQPEMTADDVRAGRAREPYTRAFLEASAGYVSAS